MGYVIQLKCPNYYFWDCSSVSLVSGDLRLHSLLSDLDPTRISKIQ